MTHESAATFGFVALWNKTDAEYAASSADEWATTERIQHAFALGRERGNVTYGLFRSRWASPYAYMTFWRCPSADSLFDSIADLERAGDFKFADSYHVFGPLSPESRCVSADGWETIPEVSPNELIIGLFVQWRSGRQRNRPEPDAVLAALDARVQLLGDYRSRLSSGWDRFAFAVAYDEKSAHAALLALSDLQHSGGVDLRTWAGDLQQHYRFATHLQTEFPWLNTEEAT